MEEMPGNNTDMEQRYCKNCNGETMQEKTLLRQGTGKTKPMYDYKCSRCGHVWKEFMPMKCPNCDALFGIKEV